MTKDRTLILDEVRVRFDCALRSDYRAVSDLVQWAPGLLPTVDFKRATDLIAEAVASRPTANNVIRLAVNQRTRSWQPPAAAGLWFLPEDAPAQPPETPTVLRTGEPNLFLAFVEILRQRIKQPNDLENLVRFLSYIKTLELPADTLYVGSLAANPFGEFAPAVGAQREGSTRAVPNVGFSQVAGPGWPAPKPTARLSITNAHGLLLAEFQSTL